MFGKDLLVMGPPLLTVRDPGVVLELRGKFWGLQSRFLWDFPSAESFSAVQSPVTAFL